MVELKILSEQLLMPPAASAKMGTFLTGVESMFLSDADDLGH